MRAIRSTLVLLFAVALAPTAYGQSPPWTVSPLNDLGMAPAERAQLAALPRVPDLLEPLWDRTSAMALVTATLGPPDQVDGDEARWEFATLSVEVEDRKSLTFIEISARRSPDRNVTRTLDVQLGVLSPFFHAALGSCGDALTRFGQPSHKQKGTFVWASAGRGRDVAAFVSCRDKPESADDRRPFAALGRVRGVYLTRTEFLPEHHVAIVKAALPTVTLPARFTQVGGERSGKKARIDPRTLWPSGFVPGLSADRLLDQVGVPSFAEEARDGFVLRWALVLVAWIRDGRLGRVSLTAEGVRHYAAVGLTSPLIPMLGQPLTSLTELLGPPLVRSQTSWRWTAAGHELSVVAMVEDGHVNALVLDWSPPPQIASLPCAELLSAQPSRAPKPVEFRSLDRRLRTPQLVPFKLWFGANHRDVVDRLGTPRECAEDGTRLEFPGIIAAFGAAGLERIVIDVDLLSAEHYAAKDPLIAVLRKGSAAIAAHLGEPIRGHGLARPVRHHRFEHGTQHLIVTLGQPGGIADYDLPTHYRVKAETGIDFGVITGLRLDALPAADRASLRARAGARPRQRLRRPADLAHGRQADAPKEAQRQAHRRARGRLDHGHSVAWRARADRHQRRPSLPDLGGRRCHAPVRVRLRRHDPHLQRAPPRRDPRMKTLLSTVAWLALWSMATHARAPSWWSPLAFESNPRLSEEQLDLIDKAAPRADLFEPLWAERSYLEQMKAAFGPPDLERVDGSDWVFSSALVRIDERDPSVTKIALHWNADITPGMRTFDPARVAFGAYLPATKSCSDALTVLGKPSSAVSRERVEWTTLGHGRDAYLAVLCFGLHDTTVVDIRLTRTTPQDLARLNRPTAAVALPKAFVAAPPAAPADPRPHWPPALLPGQALSVVLAALGPPGWVVRDTDTGTDHLHYGNAMRIDGDSAGRIAAVAFTSHVAELQRRFKLEGPILATIGRSVTALTKLIGAPTAPEYRRNGWFWDGAGHQLSIEAVDDEGVVTQLSLSWLPPVDPAALDCAEALAAAPSPPPTATTYRAPDTGHTLAHTQFLPFGLWFGATPRDVVDRIGLPRSCGTYTMSYRGLELSFADNELTSAEFQPTLLVAELRERKDPLALLLVTGGSSLNDTLGTSGSARRALFERGDEHILIGHNDDTRMPYYIAQLARGFAYDGIEGIDSLKLEASKFLSMSRPDGATSAEIPLAAKKTLAGHMHGRFMDLLGAPWTTLLQTLGPPAEATTTKTELLITWRWPEDPFGRSIAYRCSGATPMCNTLILGAERTTLDEGAP